MEDVVGNRFRVDGGVRLSWGGWASKLGEVTGSDRELDEV